MATALREMEEAREKLEIRSGRRFAGEKIAVGLVILLGLCHAMRAAWAQEVAPSKLQISSPVPEATGGFQATFPAYRIRLRDKTELGAVPALIPPGSRRLGFARRVSNSRLRGMARTTRARFPFPLTRPSEQAVAQIQAIARRQQRSLGSDQNYGRFAWSEAAGPEAQDVLQQQRCLLQPPGSKGLPWLTFSSRSVAME